MSTELDVFQEMDRRDQLQIVQETMGEIVKDLFYDVQGKKGLSYSGVNMTAFFMGDIKTDPGVDWEKFEMDDRFYWSATVRAVNETYNLASLGTAEVPEMMEVHDLDENKKWVKNPDGSWRMHLEFDRFCRRKALSMAQRNAKRAVMPEGVLEAFLRYFIRRAAGEKNLEPPFNPKKIPSEYKVLPDKAGEEERKEKMPPPTKKPPTPTKPKDEKTPKLDPKATEAEEAVKATLMANGVDTQYFLIVKYGDKVHIGVQDGYDQIGWIDDHKVITKLLKGVWVQENTRWEVPPQ